MRLFWKTKFFLWRERLRELSFYRIGRFALFDLALGAIYFFSNPFRICRRFFGRAACYGETPLYAWKKIAEAAKLSQNDLFVDLGCGRGRLCFWTAASIGCRCVGVDAVPAFIRRASFVSQCFASGRLRFVRSWLPAFSLQGVSVVYLFTFHEDEERIDFSQLAPGARVITVSDQLADSRFELEAVLAVRFPWGNTEVFIHRFNQMS